MIALIQRVAQGRVLVDQRTIGAIGPGLVALVCAERDDSDKEADAILNKVLNFRVFADAEGKMNRSLRDVAGGLLLVPQFTLAADTRSGTRPSFTPAAAPADAERLFERVLSSARSLHADVACGKFGAHMQVELTNDGPVTFWLQTPRRHQ